MNTHHNKLNIGRKLIILALSSLFGMSIVLTLFYQGLSTSLMQEKKHQSQMLSEVSINIVKHFYNLSTSNKLNETDAKKLAMQSLNSATFGKNGYFWINNSHGILKMHPYSKKFINQTNIDTVDSEGKLLFKEFIKIAKDGGGIVEYYWYKPNNSNTFRKLSYVAYFEPWDWILGTGLYLDDMENEIKKYAISALSIVFVFAIILLFISISLTRKIVLQLEGMAIRDPLTQLYTRRYLNEHMEEILLKHKRHKDEFLSVIFFDIDFFKKINDTYGHTFGDEVLMKVGTLIKDISRPDDLCIRYGGEEFVILLMSEDKNTTINLAERIRTKTHEIVFNHNEVKFSVTISAGIATMKGDEALSQVIERADLKLYEAKEAGRDIVMY